MSGAKLQMILAASLRPSVAILPPPIRTGNTNRFGRVPVFGFTKKF